MRLILALKGDLEKHIEQERKKAATGITRGTRTGAVRLQKDFRSQVRAAGLGRKLEKAVRVVHYPKSGDSISAASVVFSKAKRLHSAFSIGPVIRVRRAKFMPVALPAAVKLGLHTNWRKSAPGAGNARKWSNIDAAIRRFGAVRYVKTKRGNILVVADNLTAGLKRSKVRTRKKRGDYSPITGRRVSVALFVLVKQVRLPRRIDAKGAKRRAQRELGRDILNNWPGN